MAKITATTTHHPSAEAYVEEKLIRDQDKFMLRLPDGMRDRIGVEAKSNGRSMNAEIVARLEDSFLEAVRLPDDLKSRIQASATQNMRTLSAEVLQILLQYFPPEPTLDEILDNIEFVLAWREGRANPGYRRRLNETLKDVRDRLERGEIPETMDLPVFSSEEVERRKRGKTIGDRLRRDRMAQETLIAEAGPDIDALLAMGYLNHVDPYRKRSAKNLLEAEGDDKTYEAMLLLGLTAVEFPDEKEAAEVLYHALVADLAGD